MNTGSPSKMDSYCHQRNRYCRKNTRILSRLRTLLRSVAGGER